MRKLFFHIILLTSIAACNNKQAEKPLWVNKSDIVIIPRDSLFFKSEIKEWEATLLSFTQPIPLNLYKTKEGFLLIVKNKAGIIEGPAQLVLSCGNQHFYYDMNLHNESFGNISEKDYRSPKTVNPDSSLQQQRIAHRMDEWRNLINSNQSLNYFEEEWLSLQIAAGTFRAQTGKPLSAFYIQPGSAANVKVNGIYNKEEDVFMVTAGPLKDISNNTIANGTVVVFEYNDNETNYRMEASTINGFAIVKIPAVNKKFTLSARVNETISSVIQLNAR